MSSMLSMVICNNYHDYSISFKSTMSEDLT